MTIIFDLDYTLLDTVMFKEALKEVVTSLGVSPERYEETYKQIVKREGKTYDYDPGAHIEALHKDLGGQPGRMAEVMAKINQVLARTEEFLYPGSVELLNKYRNSGAKLVLLTLGNEKWQQAKVKHSGLTVLFDEVVATGKNKSEIIKTLAEGDEKVIIVNDNGEEMKDMIAEVERWREKEGSVPEIKFLLKKGPKPSPADLPLEPMELDEVEKAIDAEIGEASLKTGEPPESRRDRR